LVAQILASWNPLRSWLRHLNRLRVRRSPVEPDRRIVQAAWGAPKRGRFAV